MLRLVIRAAVAAAAGLLRLSPHHEGVPICTVFPVDVVRTLPIARTCSTGEASDATARREARQCVCYPVCYFN